MRGGKRALLPLGNCNNYGKDSRAVWNCSSIEVMDGTQPQKKEHTSTEGGRGHPVTAIKGRSGSHEFDSYVPCSGGGILNREEKAGPSVDGGKERLGYDAWLSGERLSFDAHQGGSRAWKGGICAGKS